jgi:hypothetical protein
MFRFRLSETILGKLVEKWDASRLAEVLTPLGNMPFVWAVLSGFITFGGSILVLSILNGGGNGAIVAVSALIGFVFGANMHSKEFRVSLVATILGRDR